MSGLSPAPAASVKSVFIFHIRERTRTFRQKFHTSSSSPLFEKTVKHMREIAPITQVGAIDHVADIEVKPSKW